MEEVATVPLSVTKTPRLVVAAEICEPVRFGMAVMVKVEECLRCAERWEGPLFSSQFTGSSSGGKSLLRVSSYHLQQLSRDPKSLL